MSDARLAELLRQRALLSEHMAWIDAEIARAGHPPAPATAHPTATAESGSAAALPLPSSTPVAPAVDTIALANQRADEIIAEYATTDKFNPAAARRSCLLLALAAFLLGTAALIGLYLLKYR